MESMLTQWCYVLDISITSNDNDNAIPINQGSIVFKRSLLFFFFFAPSLSLFSLRNSSTSTPRRGERDKIDKPLVEWPRGDDAPSVVPRSHLCSLRVRRERNAGTYVFHAMGWYM